MHQIYSMWIFGMKCQMYFLCEFWKCIFGLQRKDENMMLILNVCTSWSYWTACWYKKSFFSETLLNGSFSWTTKTGVVRNLTWGTLFLHFKTLLGYETLLPRKLKMFLNSFNSLKPLEVPCGTFSFLVQIDIDTLKDIVLTSTELLWKMLSWPPDSHY
jgi:hypothetical protein